VFDGNFVHIKCALLSAEVTRFWAEKRGIFDTARLLQRPIFEEQKTPDQSENEVAQTAKQNDSGGIPGENPPRGATVNFRRAGDRAGAADGRGRG